jgi:hypothetical protein
MLVAQEVNQNRLLLVRLSIWACTILGEVLPPFHSPSQHRYFLFVGSN